MLEWILVLTMAALGMLAFAILFKASPSDTTGLKSEQVRQDLAKLAKKEDQKKKDEKSKEEQRKKAEKEKVKEKAEKKPAAKDDKDKKAKNRSPERQRAQEVVVEEPPEENPKAIYIPNVPVFNHTPTTKPQKREGRSRSPAKEEKREKKEVVMPSKKQIERDMCQGFVVVQKKGPPPLTPEQRKERELLRQKEEEEEKKREADQLAREKERERKRAEASATSEVSLLDVKAKLDKQKQERQSKEEERRRVNCVVKQYTKGFVETEETEKKSWSAAVMPEGGEEMPAFDAEDYPRLQPTD